mmetsp:Transcript_3828/g.5955  ORF Transcript_3828/g.5955 Transcript_3828/m.5955 type:complete len:223 (-) Transcript_3828:94-762(-)|eukprot:CAMPEP_0185030084 /NCGR_PEP_ID=MMETSP1103-20130426/16842_1 /TAXON_ID=36769 /ORGANISM="Paraphysomonas bandaiensis, Strain Caron Lab Isolate" /LENGTH=222 /DNA_ID=CAMNT_0027565067 /DNA_START=11 /DNA_END=679 /DNA_ORIENTATION=-
MGSLFSKRGDKKTPTGWKFVESHHVYVKMSESQHVNPPSMNPNFHPERIDSKVQHSYVGVPVDIILEVVLGEGLWPFIDSFGSERQPSTPPVKCLTLDAKETGPGGRAINLSSDVLNPFFNMLVLPSSQGMEVVKLTVQNISLKEVSTSLGEAVERMQCLNEVELFSNAMDDKQITHFVTRCLENKALTKVTVSGQALSSHCRDKLERMAENKRPDIQIYLY